MILIGLTNVARASKSSHLAIHGNAYDLLPALEQNLHWGGGGGAGTDFFFPYGCAGIGHVFDCSVFYSPL